MQLGAGEVYLLPLAVALGAGAAEIGILASGPLLAAAAVQLLAVRWMDRAVARRRIVAGGAWVQAAVWLPLMVLPWWRPTAARAALLPSVLAYFALGALVLPAWTSWIADLVPADRRGQYFARREGLRLAVHLAAILAAGGVLTAAQAGRVEPLGFTLIFAMAGAARAASAGLQGTIHEPVYVPPPPARRFRFRQFLRAAPHSNFGRFSLATGALFAGVNLAAPFFTLYMLRELDLGWPAFTGATVVSLLAQVVSFGVWGRLGDRYGTRFVLLLTLPVTAAIPLLWLAVSGVWGVLAIQLASGLTWAGLTLSASNFLLDAVESEQRPRSAAYANVCTNLGIFTGALAGGGLALVLPDRVPWIGTAAGVPSPLPMLFVCSAGVRAAAAAALLVLVHEVRPVAPLPAWWGRLHIAGTFPMRVWRARLRPGRRPRRRRGSPPPPPRPPPGPD